jgi:hypothetical protein
MLPVVHNTSNIIFKSSREFTANRCRLVSSFWVTAQTWDMDNFQDRAFEPFSRLTIKKKRLFRMRGGSHKDFKKTSTSCNVYSNPISIVRSVNFALTLNPSP